MFAHLHMHMHVRVVSGHWHLLLEFKPRLQVARENQAEYGKQQAAAAILYQGRRSRSPGQCACVQVYGDIVNYTRKGTFSSSRSSLAAGNPPRNAPVTGATACPPAASSFVDPPVFSAPRLLLLLLLLLLLVALVVFLLP